MPIPDDIQPIQRACLRDEVYDTLLHWVVRGNLQPGEKINDNELAEHLGVSRTPVREALRRLEDKSFVEAAAGRWTRVSEVNIEEAEKIYPIIVSLEQLALELATPYLTADVFNRMHTANTHLKEALAVNDAIRASVADTEFHHILLAVADNPYLTEMLADLKLRHLRIEVVYFGGCLTAKDSITEHTRIVDTLSNGDIALACDLIKTHHQMSLNRLRASKRPSV